MKNIIECMPSDTALAICRHAWDLTNLVFVRKMENIVFSCQRDGQTVFLRLTTPFRRSKSQIEAELHFITHLMAAGLRVPKIIPNTDGQQLITIKDDDQLYEAVVFALVEGEHPAIDFMATPSFLNSLGALMAKMHQISHKYEALSRREHWYEERGIRHALDAAKVSKHTQMREKLDEVMNWIHRLEKTPETYGLVHADLSPSNIFVTSDGSIGIIDFDDSCYHFYAFDLAIVIYSMANRFAAPVSSDLEKEWISLLIKGYQTIQPLTQGQIEQIPHFIDFACLRVYFWIEYHQNLNTFRGEAIERILTLKKWVLNRMMKLNE